MPRKARINAPGALHHIIIRGIERRPIFKDSQDYQNFIERFANILINLDHLMGIVAGRLNLTPSAVSKLVSRWRLETKTREIAKELPEVK